MRTILARLVTLVALFAICVAALKRVGSGGSDDDSHIFSVLLVRLGLREHNDDFQIRIYTTQAEFSPPLPELYWSLVEGFVFPLAGL